MEKDSWDKADIVAKTVAAILIPVALLVVGHWYDSREKISTERRLEAEAAAKRITDLLKSLSSDSPRERSMALAVAQYFGRKGQLPEELLPPIRQIALHDPSADVARAAGGALNAAATRTPSLANEIITSVAQEPARVYIHIASEAQRDLAKRIAALLGVEWLFSTRD